MQRVLYRKFTIKKKLKFYNHVIEEQVRSVYWQQQPTKFYIYIKGIWVNVTKLKVMALPQIDIVFGGPTVLISFHRAVRVTTEEFVIFYSTCRKTLGQHPHCIIHKHPSTHIIRTSFTRKETLCIQIKKLWNKLKTNKLKYILRPNKEGARSTPHMVLNSTKSGSSFWISM